jgi:hypothetical protein
LITDLHKHKVYDVMRLGDRRQRLLRRWGAALMAALARAEVVRAGGARACLPGAPANAW